MKKKAIAVVMGVLLSAAVLSGCNGKGTAGSGRGTLGTAEATPSDTAADPEKPDENEPTPAQPAEDDTVYVDNIADLIEAIQPDAKIVIKPGNYNISDYIQDVWDTDFTLWNKHHDYASIQEVYDGVELVIRDVEGLSIRGETGDRADVELVTDPRYAAVIRFEACDKLVLSGFTMGHTNRGECWGSVIDLISCDSVILDNMDLYGCGVIGLNLEYCSTFLRCNDTVIRECSQGPLNNTNSRGDWKFYNCQLIDSKSGGFFSESNSLKLYFEDCTFGDRETENFMFRDDTTVKNCTWGDPSNYPDYTEYEDAPEEMQKSNLTVTPFDEYVISYRDWTGFDVIDDATGEIAVNGNIAYFFDDGTGVLVDDQGEESFTWYMNDDYSALVFMDSDSKKYTVTIYVDQTSQNASCGFMEWSDNSAGMWFY